MIDDCHRLLKLRATNRGITIHTRFEPSLPPLGGRTRVRQICLNLLSNAIKFTPQGGEVWLKAGWTASGGQYVSVRDNGPGIPDEISIVLDNFGQVPTPSSPPNRVRTLGLPIVRSLIDLHGVHSR